MKTTIAKLRRTIRKTLAEALNSRGLDPRHLKELAEWVSINTEMGQEEDYDGTVASYMEACADDGDPVTQEFVEEHLDAVLQDDNNTIESSGGLIVDYAQEKSGDTNENGLSQRHLDDLVDWITEASEEGMEEDYDGTVASYMEACKDDGEVVEREFVEAHLDHILNTHGEIEDAGGMIIHGEYGSPV